MEQSKTESEYDRQTREDMEELIRYIFRDDDKRYQWLQNPKKDSIGN